MLKKKNKPDLSKLEHSTDENPYFNEIKGYLDIRSADRANAAMWRMIAFILSFITLLAVSGMIWLSSQSKFIPMVFYTDQNGAMGFGGIANQRLKITQPMIANQLKDYIIDLRQLPLDDDLRNQYLRQVKMMTVPDLFNNTLVPAIMERYKSNVGRSIKVNITNVYPVNKGQTTWTVEWDETVGSTTIGSFKGSISFTLDSTIVDPLILLYDPLGMVINDVNINQEVQ